LDILGFKALVKCSEAHPRVLADIVASLNEMAELDPTEYLRREVHYEGMTCVGTSNERRYTTQFRSFSDSLAIFIPTETHAIADLLCKVRIIHDRLLESGCCMRGAVTIGDMYWSDAWCDGPVQTSSSESISKPKQAKEMIYDRRAPSNTSITLGPALIEAHKLESEIACYPRFIFSTELIAHIKEMATKTPNCSLRGIHDAVSAGFLCSRSTENHARSLLDFIRADADGISYLDLFHRDIYRNDTERIEKMLQENGRTSTELIRDGMTHEKFMRNTRNVIAGFLQEDAPESVRAKQRWLADYFNQSVAGTGIEPLVYDR
jgi:hypothetical protein